MFMSNDQLHGLIEKYITGQCSPGDMDNLRSLLQHPNNIAELKKIMDHQLSANYHSADDFSDVVSRISNIIQDKIELQKATSLHRQMRVIRKWTIAASFIILLTTSAFLLLFNRSEKIIPGVDAELVTDIPPGTEGAILTLADGRTVVLDNMNNGIVAVESGAKIILRDGQIVYKADRTLTENIGYNTMTTPKGRQFQLQLPDGSKVWMNAESSLRYPTAFIGKERKVEVTGEVYFEVMRNSKMPFLVKVNDNTEVEVLGTQFNINSYLNETNVKTTLLEGSVQIFNGDKKSFLKPGEQAQVNSEKQIKIVRDVDIEKVMAWKNGVFNFQDVSLAEVMRQLERWYDIEVIYEKNVPDLEFVGKLRRDLTLNEILRGLEVSEVHFRLEAGRKVIVMP